MRHTVERHPGEGLELAVHRFVDERAPPSGTTVLVLHGFMDSGATWDWLAEHLSAEGHVVLAPDLRGFGASDRVGDGGYYHFPDYVADVRRLLDALAPRSGGERVVLVGHSMGGTIAVLFTGTCPERVHKLALLEGVGPPAMPPEAAVIRFRAWLGDLDRPREPRPLASLDDAVRRLAKTHPNVGRELLASRARLLTTVGPDGRLRWCHDPLHRSTSPTPFNADVLKAFLAEIRCPVLFVGGGADGWHPLDEDERLAALPSPPRRLDIEGAGHMMHWTRPADVARALIEHIRG